MSFTDSYRRLHQLAQLYGIQTAYYDISHRRQPASAESLLAMLRSLGAPIATVEDAHEAWREKRQVLWQRVIEPVTVVWDGEPSPVPVRIPHSAAEAAIDCTLVLETGEQSRWQCPGADMPVVSTAEVEGTQYAVRQLSLPGLPSGYHRLTLDLKGKQAESLLISAPCSACNPPDELGDRLWGLFIPLYALHSEKNWGCGDFATLEALTEWMAKTGGKVVATLPMLAAFFDDSVTPSPYLPVSRLFWSEFYLDIDSIPELQASPSARSLMSSSSFRNEMETLRRSQLVDYTRQMALKRQVLEELCRSLFAGESRRLEELRHFMEANPLLEDYARFRAVGEKRGEPWKRWPHPLREGTLSEGDYNEEDRRYHLYVQWLARQQMERVSSKTKEKGIKLYLDMPLGVHPDGYDVWRERHAFITEATAGAPPDAVFTRGQNWAFPPLHPEKIREQGYRYIINYLQHHLRHAGMLRIDHVMGLHRLFCIPEGIDTSQGVYLRYRSEELYAILALESQRHKAIIVGEDLGMVPPYVRPAMKKHGFHRMYVLHYELASNPQKEVLAVPRHIVASLNTHDMPPFASFWQGHDIGERGQLGLLDREGVKKERLTHRAVRQTLLSLLQRRGWLAKSVTDTESVLRACLSFLASSQAQIVLINLEDLWLEMKPQNVPSTLGEYPNWQRKARYNLEEFGRMPRVLETLRIINRLRHQGG